MQGTSQEDIPMPPIDKETSRALIIGSYLRSYLDELETRRITKL